MDKTTSKFTRRQFLKLAGATSALAIPALLGYGLLRTGEGEFPPNVSPYAVAEGTDRLSPLGAVSSPLLLLTNERAENPFGSYLAEILRTEGLNCFQVAHLSAMDSDTLSRFSLVLLAEGPLDTSQVELLTNYVARGGRLVAMRPDARLASLFGLERAAGSTVENYLQVEADHPLGQGMVTWQFHGAADHYRLAGAQTLAWLADKSGGRADFPAVTIYRYKQGRAALWAFDLARSVAYTRQGNPAWANQERDEREGIRAQDAFVGWVDLDRIATPQADEQMRLLSRLIDEMLSDVLPLPRLWYFPDAAGAMLIATGDSHQNPTSSIEDVLARVERRGGHMSIYYAPPLASDWRRAARRAKWWLADLPVVRDALATPSNPPTPHTIAVWRARGHEFALHPYVEEGLEAGWRRYWKEFTGLGYGPVPPTVRTHRILWKDWVETARVQAAHGLRMNLDYYHYGPAFQNQTGEWVYGYFTGSGLPMKFVDEQGRILNIYQQPTQLVDEHLMKMPWGLGGENMGAEAAIEVSRTILRRSLDGAYGAIAAQCHVDPFTLGVELATRSARWLEGMLDYAAMQGIAIWSAAEWLRFTQVRHDTTFEQVQWDPATRRLSFRLEAQAIPNVKLTVLFPLWNGETKLDQVDVDGLTVSYRERQVGNSLYGWISVEASSHHVQATFA